MRQGGLPAQAAEILTDILIQRRDKLVAHWYARVTPIERPRATTSVVDSRVRLGVSFDDLGIQAGIWKASVTTYRWRFEDPSLGVSAEGEEQATPSRGRTSLRLDIGVSREQLRSPAADDELATLRITSLRPGAEAPVSTIFLRRTGSDPGYRVVGLTH